MSLRSWCSTTPRREWRTATRALRCCVLVGALCSRVSLGGTVLAEPFNSLYDWRVTTLGPATIGLAKHEDSGTCVRAESLGGLALCSRELPLADVRGTRLTVRCLTESGPVSRGPQAWNLPKLHVAVRSRGGIRHFASRINQAKRWTATSLIADVPDDATRVLLSFGIENAAAVTTFDNLLVLNDRREVRTLDLSSALTHYVRGVPGTSVRWEDGVFEPSISETAKGKLNCIALRGAGHEGLPAAVPASIPVGAVVNTVYLLHATMDGADSRDTPCVIWTARFWDGNETSLSLFEGRDIGDMRSRRDLRNWKIAWRGTAPDGTPVVLGVTKWQLYATDAPLESLSARTYSGGAQVVAAITVVAEPPPDEDDVEPWEDEWGE